MPTSPWLRFFYTTFCHSPFCLANLVGVVALAPHLLAAGDGEGRNSQLTAEEPRSLGGTKPVACAAFEQLQNIPQKARLREGSEFNRAGTKKAGLLGEQRREGARLGFPEPEPRGAGFPNSSKVQV